MAPNDSQADVEKALVLAANCLLYEADGGPDVNLTDETSPWIVSHAEAAQVVYAQILVVELDASLERLLSTSRACHQAAATHHAIQVDLAQRYARAADLCDRAARFVVEEGAVDDASAQQRLTAICAYNSNVGMLAMNDVDPGVAEDLFRQELEETLRQIDAETPPVADLPVRSFEGPTYDAATGKFVIGHGAGEIKSYWRLNIPGEGMANGLIVGPRDIGKTTTLLTVIVEASIQPNFNVWIADPAHRHNHDQTFGGIAATTATDLPQTQALLQDALEVIKSRKKDSPVADPSPARPGIVIAIEDCHTLFSDNLDATHLAARIADEGNPSGVGIVATSTDVSLDAFGGSLSLRNNLAKTNCAAMGPNARHLLRELGMID